MVLVALDLMPVQKRPEGCISQPSGLFLCLQSAAGLCLAIAVVAFETLASR
jgi:hypothetical protein